MAKLIDSIKSFVNKKMPKKVERTTIESAYVLETENLGISFGGLKAVQNVNLKIEKNEIYGLVGPNGAGKTTVFPSTPRRSTSWATRRLLRARSPQR